MRRIGSWLLILAAWGVLVMVYFATPYMMHAHSQVVNFLQIVACGAVVSFGVVMLSAGVVMRKPVATIPRAAKVAAPKVRPDAGVQLTTLSLIEEQLALTQCDDTQRTNAEQAHRRIDHITTALMAMVAMARKNVTFTEGGK